MPLLSHYFSIPIDKVDFNVKLIDSFLGCAINISELINYPVGKTTGVCTLKKKGLHGMKKTRMLACASKTSFRANKVEFPPASTSILFTTSTDHGAALRDS